MDTSRMKTKWIKLVVMFAHEVMYCIAVRQALWTEDTSERNRIFNNTVIFEKELSKIMLCADACLASSAPCRRFSYTSTTTKCRGYSDIDSNYSIIHNHTTVWKKICHLKDRGYTYDFEFNVCLKFYQTNTTRQNASNFCAADGAFLLIPDSFPKVTALITQYWHFLTSFEWWWVSGYDYGDGGSRDFRWDDGTAIDDSVWAAGEPNIDTEKCVAYWLYPLRNGYVGLYDVRCENGGYFVCQETI